MEMFFSHQIRLAGLTRDRKTEISLIIRGEGGQKLGMTQEEINQYLETIIIQKMHFKSF